MKLSDKILDYMRVHNLFYMKDEGNTIFDLPYEVDGKYRVKIRLTIDEENNLVRVGFTEPLYNDSEQLKEEILKLNPRLVKGAMGISNSKKNQLEYKLSFVINETENITEELYADTVGFCLHLYKNLINRKILKNEVINERKEEV